MATAQCISVDVCHSAFLLIGSGECAWDTVNSVMLHTVSLPARFCRVLSPSVSLGSLRREVGRVHFQSHGGGWHLFVNTPQRTSMLKKKKQAGNHSFVQIAVSVIVPWASPPSGLLMMKMLVTFHSKYHRCEVTYCETLFCGVIGTFHLESGWFLSDPPATGQCGRPSGNLKQTFLCHPNIKMTLTI